MLLFTDNTSLYINSSKNLIKCRHYDSCLSPVHATGCPRHSPVGARHTCLDMGAPTACWDPGQGLCPDRSQPFSLRVLRTEKRCSQCSDDKAAGPTLRDLRKQDVTAAPDPVLGRPGDSATLTPPHQARAMLPGPYPPCLRSWCSRWLPRASALVSAAHSCCSFSWFCRCVSRSWARRAWISDSKLLLSDRCRRSGDFSCKASWTRVKGGKQSDWKAQGRGARPHGKRECDGRTPSAGGPRSSPPSAHSRLQCCCYKLWTWSP